LLLFWVGYIVAFTEVLIMYQIYHTLQCSPLSPHTTGIVSTGINFAFTYMCTHCLLCNHPLTEGQTAGVPKR
jgi:hypothetical protein